MAASILVFPLERRDAPRNTKAQINAARRRGDCDGSLWIRRARREEATQLRGLGDTGKVRSFEMGVIASLLGSLNFGQALDTLRSAHAMVAMFPDSPAAAQALNYLSAAFPAASASAAEVLALRAEREAQARAE